MTVLSFMKDSHRQAVTAMSAGMFADQIEARDRVSSLGRGYPAVNSPSFGLQRALCPGSCTRRSGGPRGARERGRHLSKGGIAFLARFRKSDRDARSGRPEGRHRCYGLFLRSILGAGLLRRRMLIVSAASENAIAKYM